VKTVVIIYHWVHSSGTARIISDRQIATIEDTGCHPKLSYLISMLWREIMHLLTVPLWWRFILYPIGFLNYLNTITIIRFI